MILIFFLKVLQKSDHIMIALNLTGLFWRWSEEAGTQRVQMSNRVLLQWVGNKTCFCD